MSAKYKNESTRAGFSRVVISFAGFYNSFIEAELDTALERDIEYAADCTGHDAIGEKLAEVVNWRAACDYIAQDYCASFGDWIEETLSELYGAKIPAAVFSFVELIRPREYNFETDRIEAEAPTAALREIFDCVMTYDGAAFRAYFSDRLASCDGFTPFYPNDISAIGPVENWPACITQILFDFIDRKAGELSEYAGAEQWYIDRASSNGEFSEALCTSDKYAAILNSIEE